MTKEDLAFLVVELQACYAKCLQQIVRNRFAKLNHKRV